MKKHLIVNLTHISLMANNIDHFFHVHIGNLYLLWKDVYSFAHF